MTAPSLTPEDVAELRREADHWAKATHTVTGPAIAKMLRGAADEIDRLRSIPIDREAEIRRAAIEECAKVVESPAWCEHTIGDGVIHAIARSIRALAQQPD